MSSPALGTVIVTQRSDAVAIGAAQPMAYPIASGSNSALVTAEESQGPIGPAGPKGDPGPPGPPGGTPSLWQILNVASFTAQHGLSYAPRALIVDAAGAEVDTDTLYAPGQVTLVFAQPFTGTLYLGG